MWFVIIIILILLIVTTTGSAEPPLAKITKLLRHYKLDATKYLQRKFGVTGTGKALIKRICDKFLIDSLEKFIAMSGLSQKALLPADKVLFLEDSRYTPTELEYEILKKLFPEQDVYELWRKNKYFKIRDNLVRAPLSKLKKVKEPLEIDILPFYGMIDKIKTHDKELSALELLLKQADRERRARILLAIIRNRDFAKYGLSSLWLDHLKDVEYLTDRERRKLKRKAEKSAVEEAEASRDTAEENEIKIEEWKKSKELSEHDKSVVDSLSNTLTPSELESLTDEVNEPVEQEELTKEELEQIRINEEKEQELINREQEELDKAMDISEEEEKHRLIVEGYPKETPNSSIPQQEDIDTAIHNSVHENTRTPDDILQQNLYDQYSLFKGRGEIVKTFNTYKKYL